MPAFRLSAILPPALFATAALLLFPNTGRGAEPEAPEYGPAKGSLLIVGGGRMSAALVAKFIELAGGPDKNFVVVPTAGGNLGASGSPRIYDEEKETAWLRKRGIKNVRMLHTHDPEQAKRPEFSAILRDADAVWFGGGRQWHIVDSYAGTPVLEEFHKVLERGGVIGGSSAGATIQGEYLVRGDTSGPDIVMTDEPQHQHGFAFLRRSAIDQHIDTRKRWNDLIPVIAKYPNLLGIGLSEATGIVVCGDKFEVFGAGKVAIHDATRPTLAADKPYLLLSSGDVYHMKERRGILAAAGTP